MEKGPYGRVPMLHGEGNRMLSHDVLLASVGFSLLLYWSL